MCNGNTLYSLETRALHCGTGGYTHIHAPRVHHAHTTDCTPSDTTLTSNTPCKKRAQPRSGIEPHPFQGRGDLLQYLIPRTSPQRGLRTAYALLRLTILFDARAFLTAPRHTGALLHHLRCCVHRHREAAAGQCGTCPPPPLQSPPLACDGLPGGGGVARYFKANWGTLH